jgi:glycine/D-amino acid oxidase-like deaminating enzyme
VVLLEAQRVGFGASGRNSGFVVDIGHYEERYGVDGNRMRTRLARAGISYLREIVQAHDIDCAWTERGRLHGAVASLGMRLLEKFVGGLEAMGEPYEWLDSRAMAAIMGTTFYRGVVRTPGTVMIQPAALARGLAAALPPSVEVFEESPVRAIHPGPPFRIEAGSGAVVAPRLFLATNGYTSSLGFLKRQVFPMFTFGSLTRPLTESERNLLGGDPEWGLVPEERMGSTIRRTRDGRILIRNTVHYASGLDLDLGQRQRVRQIHEGCFRVRFPALSRVELEYTWGGIMGMTLNGAHFFGRLDDDLFAAAGCNGVGVAMGTLWGKLLADLAVGADSQDLKDLLALPRPAWIPPEPLLGVGVRSTLARLKAKAREEL